jgi:hypothetical protein
MIIAEQVPNVMTLLETAADARKTVSFPTLFSYFPEATPIQDVYETLEAASTEIARLDVAIYSVLMAKRGTGLPGDGFFDVFRVHREQEYREIAGNTHIVALTLEQKKEMVKREKIRVYAHAGI